MATDLKPGRELDALVAEKVMGKRVHWVDGEPHWAPGISPIAPYSTDIAAAWEVVEKLKFLAGDAKSAREINIYWEDENRKWGIGWERYDGQAEYIAYADTASHAICLAALKAVGA